MKKNKYILILILTFSSLCIFARGKSDKPENTKEIAEEKIEQIEENMNNKTVTITGNVVSYGNTPFAYPGVRMEDGKTYTIQADSLVKKKLLSLQGRKIEFKGKIITQEENVLQRETFLLESYRLLD